MRRFLIGAVAAALTLSTALVADATGTVTPAASSGVAEPKADKGWGTMTDKTFTEPVVMAHRGASAYRPEHTEGAYRLAVQLGADYIEPDLVMTKDGVLVDRHEPEISGTTDVAQHLEFADRKVTKNLDGEEVTGWFVEDFTLAELRTLRAVERLPQLRQHNTIYDGRSVVPTFEEVLQWRAQLSRENRRTIGIIPELKHSTYLHAQGLNPEKEFLRLVAKYGLNRSTSVLYVQSFELTNLQELRRQGYRARSTFLATNGGAPYDLVTEGDSRTYADLLTPTSLKKLSGTINAVGVDKGLIIARNPDGTLGETTTLVDDAHAAGLEIVPWTLRPENNFLPTDYRTGTNPGDYGRAIDEALAFMHAGVDGVFCDAPDVCLTARAEYLAN